MKKSTMSLFINVVEKITEELVNIVFQPTLKLRKILLISIGMILKHNILLIYVPKMCLFNKVYLVE